LLGYLHIAFQPFFITMLSLYFLPEKVQKKIAPWIYSFCLFSVVFMIIQLFPFDWAGQCDPRRPLCAAQLCSVSGNWHIAWNIPANGIGNYFVEHGWPLVKSGYPTYV